MRCEGGACPRRRVQSLPGTSGCTSCSATATASAVMVAPSCPSSPHLPQELPSDRRLALSSWSSALQPGEPGEVSLEEENQHEGYSLAVCCRRDTHVSSPGPRHEGRSSAFILIFGKGTKLWSNYDLCRSSTHKRAALWLKAEIWISSQLCHMFFA